MRRVLGTAVALGLIAGLVAPAAALAAFLNMKTARSEIRRTVMPLGVRDVRIRPCKRLSPSHVRCRVRMRRGPLSCEGVGEASRPTTRDLYGHAWNIYCRGSARRRR